MSEENNEETLAKEIENLQKRIDSHQTLMEVLSLLVLLSFAYIFNLGIVIEGVIVLILFVRFLTRLEKGKI